MKSSSLPDGVPILSPGRHRRPRRGACFMEFASVLAGERWSDHPVCTHPVLAELARQVNDHIGDEERQRLTILVPTVVGRTGDDQTALAVPVAVAASVILDVPEGTQRVLSAGLLQAVPLCADAGPELAATEQQARTALAMVPGAVSWVERLGVRRRIRLKTFARYCAPTMVRCAVEGVVTSGGPGVDSRLRGLLEGGIAACPAPTTVAATTPMARANRPLT